MGNCKHTRAFWHASHLHPTVTAHLLPQSFVVCSTSAAMAGGPAPVRVAHRTRSRSGCLCCRRRRRKCDGAQPQCRNCRERGEECRWGLKASFHPSRSLQLSSQDRAALLAVEEERHLPVHSVQIVDDTHQVEREYRCHQRLWPPAPVARVDVDVDVDVEASTGGLELTLPGLAVSEGSGLHIAADSIATAQGGPLADHGPSFHSATPSSVRLRQSHEDIASSTSPYVPPFSLGQAVSLNASPLPEPDLPVSTVEQARLISAYLRETGTWCETTDSDMHFTQSSVHEIMENKAFAAAAMALASRQLDALRHRQRQVTLGLYQHAIQLLIHHDPSQADAVILATCTLLCVYEMMASDVGEWRRHLKGCAGLLGTKKWNGSSKGIVNACFWAFARIDVWAAFMIGEETLMPTDYWVDDSTVHSVAATGTIDAYCNLATLIFAKIANFIAESRKRSTRSVDQASTTNGLWRELQDWRAYRPKQVLPLLRSEAAQNSPFQTILYTHSSSICGNTFYHSGSILLLQTGNVRQDRTCVDTDQYNPVWHAKELGGISVSNPSHANWVNQLQPLYLAGKVFCDGSAKRHSVSSRMGEDEASADDEYPAEKIALLKHLAKIERETGWNTSSRASDLRKLWGIE
ncbi:putative Zn(II)2Cys6 transcription factor [Paraphoma chrysanthemicola]|nr:putative Zn(II)2Cys6 transcription factor [Paraphoma chrysanthemicola]